MMKASGDALVLVDLDEQKQIQASLEESREKYRGLSEAAFEAIFFSEEGICLEQNRRAEEMFGYTSAEAIGRPGTDWIVAHDRLHVMQKMRNRDENPYEVTALRKDGSTFPALLHGKTMRYKGRTVRVTSLSDITERKRAEAALRESEQLLAAIIEQSPVSMGIVGMDGRIERINRRMIQTLGYLPEDIPDLDQWWVRAYPDLAYRAEMMTQWSELLEQAMAGNQEIEGRECRVSCKDGSNKTMFIYGMLVAGKVFVILDDFTERKAAEEQIRRLAFFDPLTRLPNRRLLLDRLAHALVSSERSRRCGALIFIDLDHFKTLNDTRGHEIGDQLLVEIAVRLQACVRQGDTVARLGGDEFVVVLDDLDAGGFAAAQAEAVAVKILAALSQPCLLEIGLRDGVSSAVTHHCTSSIGISLYSGRQQSVDELISRADLAMYQAKAAGRNTLRFFDPAMQAAVRARAALEADLRQGLREGQFVLYYQAQVDGDGCLTGAEALVRWQHPQRGLVAPLDFIALAESTGMILPLGRWVLETACAQLAVWARDPARAQLTLAVNVSAREFHHPDFVGQVLAALGSSGASPQKLKLELTESLLLDDLDDTIGKMRLLKAQEIGFALDDFGTGYSSLAYLKRLPLDQLKIDRSFVRDVLNDPSDAAIARTIVALGQSLGLAVVAEGVETAAQRDFLASIGCSAYQGYLFGRPVPAAIFFDSFCAPDPCRGTGAIEGKR
jgi:diguanylate cyclase (GGDEF)-like protein/PAS domain S-box-containing protein